MKKHYQQNHSPVNRLCPDFYVDKLYFSPINLNDMNVNIQTVRFDADMKLRTYIEKNCPNYPSFTNGSPRWTYSRNSIMWYITSRIKWPRSKDTIPRHEFFVKHSSKSFEESFDAALDSLITQIKKEKSKPHKTADWIVLDPATTAGFLFIHILRNGFKKNNSKFGIKHFLTFAFPKRGASACPYSAENSSFYAEVAQLVEQLICNQ